MGTPPKRTIVDGEIVRWSPAGRLDFAALQRRVGGSHARHLSIVEPTHLVLFDLLEINGVDIRTQPLAERRKHLEGLFAGIPAACPLALSMQTDDPVEARLWFTSLAAHGIEGLVIKAAAEPYQPGARSWWKYKSRTSTEAILAGVTGSLARPSGLPARPLPAQGRAAARRRPDHSPHPRPGRRAGPLSPPDRRG